MSCESANQEPLGGGVRPGSRKRTFTLVELFVVVGIIAFLLALLAPALELARRAARRSQCNNNLKQIGLGLQNYADVNKCFPTAPFGDDIPTTLRA